MVSDRTVVFPVTLSDPWPKFKGRCAFQRRILFKPMHSILANSLQIIYLL